MNMIKPKIFCNYYYYLSSFLKLVFFLYEIIFGYFIVTIKNFKSKKITFFVLFKYCVRSIFFHEH